MEGVEGCGGEEVVCGVCGGNEEMCGVCGGSEVMCGVCGGSEGMCGVLWEKKKSSVGIVEERGGIWWEIKDK